MGSPAAAAATNASPPVRQAPSARIGATSSAWGLVSMAMARLAPAQAGARRWSRTSDAIAGSIISGSRYPRTSPFRTVAGLAQYASATHAARSRSPVNRETVHDEEERQSDTKEEARDLHGGGQGGAVDQSRVEHPVQHSRDTKLIERDRGVVNSSRMVQPADLSTDGRMAANAINRGHVFCGGDRPDFPGQHVFGASQGEGRQADGGDDGEYEKQAGAARGRGLHGVHADMTLPESQAGGHASPARAATGLRAIQLGGRPVRGQDRVQTVAGSRSDRRDPRRAPLSTGSGLAMGCVRTSVHCRARAERRQGAAGPAAGQAAARALLVVPAPHRPGARLRLCRRL